MKHQASRKNPTRKVRQGDTALRPRPQPAAEPRAWAKTYFGVNWVLLADPDEYEPPAPPEGE